MRKRGRNRFGLVAVLLLAAAAWVVWTWVEAPEPAYKGLHLSVCCLRLTGTISADEGRWSYERRFSETNSEVQAIRQIGTNAIPFLLKWIQYEPSPWKIRFCGTINPWLARLNPRWQWQDRSQERATGAILAFGVIGQRAQAAIPALNQLIQETHSEVVAQRATTVLPYFGEAALPLLIAVALTNQYSKVRAGIIERFDTLPELVRPAEPLFFQGLKDTNINVAATTLGIFPRGNITWQRAVPALREVLKHPDPKLRAEAARVLGWHYSFQAQSATPQLLELLKDGDASVRREASNALWYIEPEVLTSGTAAPTR